MPCPFCGGTHLRVVDWYDDTRGEFDAIEAALTTIDADDPASPAWELLDVREDRP